MTPQELKYSILQLAIQGKLVEQRPEEGTAEELYRQIQQEKQALIKAGKLKKEKPLPEITEDEKPFDIPESWKWVRLNDLCSLISDGTHKTPTYVESGIPFLSVKDISSGFLDFSNTRFISQKEHYALIERCKPEKDDILICRIGTLGKAVRIDTKIEFSIFVSLGLIKLVEKTIADYIVLTINSGYGYSWIQRVKVGGGTHTFKINLDDLRSMQMPLPPLAEQERIVAKIEELLPLIERYEKAWSRLEDFNKRFPVDMQKSILQMAIQGKLVEQRPEEGTGEELYKQIQQEKHALIKAGKIKKEKPIPEITENEVPFDIPESWKWVRLSNLASAIVDCPHSTPHYHEQSTDYVAIDTNCIDADGNITGWRYVDEETYRVRISRLQPILNDIVYTREGSICRAAILPANKAVCLGQRVMLIRCPDGVLSEYIKMILMAPQTVNTLTAKQKGIGAKHVNVADVCNLLLPLPPTTEQERIIAKLELLMPLCRRLK